MRRAAVSVQANIAEGAGRWGPTEFHHFLSMAKGSAAELDAETELAKRFGYLSPEEAESVLCLLNEVAGMIVRLRQTLAQSAVKSPAGTAPATVPNSRHASRVTRPEGDQP
jgi:four helix bundle protein